MPAFAKMRTCAASAPMSACGRRSTNAITFDPRGAQGGGRPIGGIAVGRDDDPLAAGNAEGMSIFVRGAGQHDARTIVVRENHRPLERAGGGDDGARANFPQPFAKHAARTAPRRASRRRRAQRFARAHEIVIVNAEGQGSSHAAARRSARRVPMSSATCAIAAPGQRTAERGPARQQQRVRARLRGGHRSAQSRDAAADHQAPRPARHFLVAIGIRLRRRLCRDRPCGESWARTHASWAT